MSLSPRWIMVNGVKYQTHDEFWRLGELMFEEVDLGEDEDEDEPEQGESLAHLELQPIVDWDLPSPETPRLDTPREVGSLLSLSYTNVSTPSPREDNSFWDTITNMSLEDMVNYVTGN